MSQGAALEQVSPAAETVSTPEANSYGVLIAVSLGALLAPLNSTMIAVSLPRIIDDLDSSVETTGWLITSYLITLAVLQPFAAMVVRCHHPAPTEHRAADRSQRIAQAPALPARDRAFSGHAAVEVAVERIA